MSAALHGALEASVDLGTPPTPCPHCGGAMGDGDRVSFGRCAPCRRARRAR